MKTMNKDIIIYIFLPILSLLFLQRLSAQSDIIGCETEELPEFLTRDYPDAIDFRSNSDPYIVKLYVRIITRDDGTKGVGLDSIDNELNRLESYFAEHGICFMLTGKDYINDSYYADHPDFSFNTLKDSLVIDYPPVGYSINIYILPEITFFRGASYGEYLCITADRFNTCHLAHEIGHSLGLPHTHQGSSSDDPDIRERVDSSNCETAGDGFCDTPADPKLNSTNVDSISCTYIDNTVTDLNGDIYNPDVTNIMSYAPYSCRGFFTPDQVDRMRNRIQFAWIPLGFTVEVENRNLVGLDMNAGRASFTAKGNIKAESIQIEESAKVDLVARDYVLIQPGSIIDPSGSGYFEASADFFCNGVYPDVYPLVIDSSNSSMLENESSEIIVSNQIKVFPNPFSSTTNIEYQISTTSSVHLAIYDFNGRILETLIQVDQQEEGTYQVPFDASHLPAGFYFARLITNTGSKTTKLLLE